MRIRSPTLTTLALFVVVFALQQIGGLLGVGPSLFVLAPPIDRNPWTLVTSVYAHAGLGHLLANSLALALPGILLERKTSNARFHAFFIGSGALAGAAEITLGNLVGEPSGVLGASGAVFALMGYLVAANRLTDAAIGGVGLSSRVQGVAFVAIAVAVTVVTGAPGVALVAHFTGLLVGLVAGRLHLLRRD